MAFSAVEQRDVSERRPSLSDRPNEEADWPKPIGDLLDELDIPDKMVRGESFLAKQHQERKAKAQHKKEATVELAENALKRLDEELKKGKSETLVQFLSTMAKFHSYSFNNQLLIMMQRPDATRVAGFNAWKKLDRFVKKGEKGIRILAPMVGKAKQDPEEGADLPIGTPQKRLYGFRVASVFDVSQTDGKPLPDIGQINGEPGKYLPRLRELVRSMGIQLEYEQLNGPEGISKGGTIVIDSRLDSANEFSVLAHELAHEMLHRGDRRESTTKTQRETEAEAVAFVVAQVFGVDTRARSSDYIQLYQGDSELLATSLKFVRKAAAEMVVAVSAESTKNEKGR